MLASVTLLRHLLNFCSTASNLLWHLSSNACQSQASIRTAPKSVFTWASVERSLLSTFTSCCALVFVLVGTCPTRARARSESRSLFILLQLRLYSGQVVAQRPLPLLALEQRGDRMRLSMRLLAVLLVLVLVLDRLRSYRRGVGAVGSRLRLWRADIRRPGFGLERRHDVRTDGNGADRRGRHFELEVAYCSYWYILIATRRSLLCLTSEYQQWVMPDKVRLTKRSFNCLNQKFRYIVIHQDQEYNSNQTL